MCLLWFYRNLQFAAEQLESTGIIGVIEPINNYSLPGYYLSSYEKGVTWNYDLRYILHLLIMLERLFDWFSNVCQSSFLFPEIYFPYKTSKYITLKAKKPLKIRYIKFTIDTKREGEPSKTSNRWWSIRISLDLTDSNSIYST